MSAKTDSLPASKSVTCPQVLSIDAQGKPVICGRVTVRDIIWFGDREILADRGCLCDDCATAQANAVRSADARTLHLEQWRLRCPDDYHRADPSRVPASIRAALDWRPTEGCRRIGIWGTAGTGKSMAAAIIAREAGIPFRWTNGFAARSLYNRAVTSDDQESRKSAVRDWTRIQDAALLILDDADKGTFTEAWAGALFDLMEHRNSLCLATIWTANHGPGNLAKKFARCGDSELGDAIERRLCGGAKIFQAA